MADSAPSNMVALPYSTCLHRIFEVNREVCHFIGVIAYTSLGIVDAALKVSAIVHDRNTMLMKAPSHASVASMQRGAPALHLKYDHCLLVVILGILSSHVELLC